MPSGTKGLLLSGNKGRIIGALVSMLQYDSITRVCGASSLKCPPNVELCLRLSQFNYF